MAISKLPSLLTWYQDNTYWIAQHDPRQANHQELPPFNSLPLRPTSSNYIWITHTHTLAISFITFILTSLPIRLLILLSI